MPTDTDFIVLDHGSICVLTALSDEAQAWVDEHLPEDAQIWGPNGTVIEPRYLPPILDGIEADGLTVG